MKPGRELDALVAEKVMEWSKVRVMCNGNKCDWTGFEPGEYGISKVPRYSTNIADAWKVVEKARKEFGFIDILPYACGYETVIRTVNGDIRTKTETAPHAICLAALKAVDCDIQEEQPQYQVYTSTKNALVAMGYNLEET